MSTDSAEVPRSLPDHPNLRHLKDQAKDLVKAGNAQSLTEAQFKIACLHGFASWPKLKAYVDSLEEIGQLKQAVDTNDLKRVKALMTANPALHRAPPGYNKNGALTWVAECRVPWAAPSPERLAIAEWMMDHGSDVHQGGDGPLVRTALLGHRIPMMEVLVSRGANVNALWNGYYPIIFAPCERVEPAALQWLLDHGANPNCADPQRKYPGTALDFVIGTYGRSKQLATCIDILGSTGARRLKLRGATLLHVAAEYGNVDAAKLLLGRGADVNARATVDQFGIGGQTPIFHAVKQFGDWGLPVAKVLIDRGADLTVRNEPVASSQTYRIAALRMRCQSCIFSANDSSVTLATKLRPFSEVAVFT